MRRIGQTEVEELTSRSELLQSKTTELTFAKQKVDKEINSLKIDLEDAEDRAKLAEEKAKRILGEVDFNCHSQSSFIFPYLKILMSDT